MNKQERREVIEYLLLRTAWTLGVSDLLSDTVRYFLDNELQSVEPGEVLYLSCKEDQLRLSKEKESLLVSDPLFFGLDRKGNADNSLGFLSSNIKQVLSFFLDLVLDGKEDVLEQYLNGGTLILKKLLDGDTLLEDGDIKSKLFYVGFLDLFGKNVWDSCSSSYLYTPSEMRMIQNEKKRRRDFLELFLSSTGLRLFKIHSKLGLENGQICYQILKHDSQILEPKQILKVLSSDTEKLEEASYPVLVSELKSYQDVIQKALEFKKDSDGMEFYQFLNGMLEKINF